MANTSRIPAAIDGLLTLAQASAGLAGVQIVDGPPLSWAPVMLAVDSASECRFLFIGAVPGEDTSAEGDQDFNAAGAISYDEHFRVLCTALSWTGDQVAKAVRDDAAAIVGAVQQAIRTDPTLGGAVLYSRISNIDRLEQQQANNGVQCVAVFTITARAYLS